MATLAALYMANTCGRSLLKLLYYGNAYDNITKRFAMYDYMICFKIACIKIMNKLLHTETHTHTCIHTYTHAHAHTHAHTESHTCKHTHRHMCTHNRAFY